MYVTWRAVVRVADWTAPARLARVTEELNAYPAIRQAVAAWESGNSHIRFGFYVGLSYAPAAQSHARRALDKALAGALVGTPAPPPGVRTVSLAIELEEHPIVRPQAVER